MAQTYLVQNRSGYYFRIIVPPPVRPIVGLREIKRSLQAGALGLAKERAWIIAGKIKRFFRWLAERKCVGGKKEMKLDRDKVTEVINQYIADGLRDIEDEFLMEHSDMPEHWESETEDLDSVRSIPVCLMR